MSVQRWADSPTNGAYQEHVVDSIFREAIESAIFVPFAFPVNVESGQSFTIPIRSRLSEPTSSLLNENLSIPLDKLSITAKVVTLQERGRGVEWSSKNESRAPIDIPGEHRKALAEQMELVLDTVVGQAFTDGSQIKYVGTGPASQNIATNGSAGAAATENINFYHLRNIRDYLKRTLFCPMVKGSYVGIFSTAGIRAILDDPEFLAINQYSNREIFSGTEVGMVSNIRVIESDHDIVLDDDIGTNSDVGEGIIFGDDAVRLGMLKRPSMHFETKDHGRFVSVAWYGDFNAGTSTDSGNAGLARIVHYTSS